MIQCSLELDWAAEEAEGVRLTGIRRWLRNKAGAGYTHLRC